MRDKKEEPHLFINISNISFFSYDNYRGFLLIKDSHDILSQHVWLGKCKLNICDDGFESFTTQDTRNDINF